MLRQQYKHLLRNLFSGRLRQFRGEAQLTQEQMAEYLCVAPRSYADLEQGKYGCSGLTIIRLLILLGDNEALRLIHAAEQQMKEADHHDAA